MHIEQFMDYLAFEKNFSYNTIKSYRTDLEQLRIFLNENYSEITLQDLKLNHLRAWLQSQSENTSNKTIARKISAIKSYFKFLKKIKVVEKNPAIKLATPKKNKKLPLFVKQEAINQFLDQFPNKDDFQSYRDRLILELLYSTGIRLDELVTLSIDRVDLNNKIIRVIGKRNKERQIPITNRIIVHFNNYERSRKTLLNGANEANYFLTQKAQPIYPKLVYRIVKKFLVKITGDNAMSTHTMRHTFATHMLNNGADIYAIKEILGHSSLAATQVYTHNTYEQLKKVYNQAHPRA